MKHFIRMMVALLTACVMEFQAGGAESESQALAALEACEPVVQFDESKPGKPVIAVRFRPNAGRVTDDDLVHLKAFRNLPRTGAGCNLRTMPSSRPNTIPTVIHLVRQIKPQSILDVGVGFGKWGHLFREYTDILEAERDTARYERKNWRVKIDGIEGHAAYLTEMHRYFYHEIHIGDACGLLKTLPRYDLIFLGDVIEHLEKGAGLQLLREACERSNKAVILTTPKYETGQAELCGNELERHRSLWAARDFQEFTGAMIKTVDRDTLVAVLAKPGLPRLICGPPKRAKPADARRLHAAKEEITRLIPQGQAFILVDDEQIRSELPHTAALPFLEKDGQYWGPPADDEVAIRELGRLRQAGASHLVVVWSSFWWLDHYAGFHRYLKEKFRCIVNNDALVVFELQP